MRTLVILLLLMIPIAAATETATSNFDLRFTSYSGAFSDIEYTSNNISAAIGESLIGNVSHTSNHARYGFVFNFTEIEVVPIVIETNITRELLGWKFRNSSNITFFEIYNNASIKVTRGNLLVAGSGYIQMYANTSAFGCNSASEGAIFYDGRSNKHRGCDGTNWNDLY